MKTALIGCYMFCILLMGAQSRPEITRLFPVKELIAYHEQTNNTKPLDKLLGKLRTTYNFVFRKPENTSNIEKILKKDAPDPYLAAIRLIWANTGASAAKNLPGLKRIENKSFKEDLTEANILPTAHGTSKETTPTISNDDWLNDLEPLEPLEIQDDIDEDVETVNMPPTFELPVTLGRHLLEWLSSLLGLTFGVYTKVSEALKSS
ncbi:uncharacterized protein LOC105696080 [Orussus abietinus]|uniref:uncharacterized protein LOC105696080 n=1 Tax=Orussus abietinus TaxID=222816 RepID=UPI00062625E4|nr:uncharacterized protein LOC105696080 [Orussus abietinus]